MFRWTGELKKRSIVFFEEFDVEGSCGVVGDVHIEDVEGKHETSLWTQINCEFSWVIWVGGSLGCVNDFSLEGLKSHVEEEHHEDDDDCKRDESSREGSIGRSSVVAKELSIAEEIEEFEELVEVGSTGRHGKI